MQRSKQTQQRRDYVKKGVSAEENRRRREENSAEIRKQKKDDVLQKRRFMGDLATTSQASSETDKGIFQKKIILIVVAPVSVTPNGSTTVTYDPAFLEKLNSNDINAQLEGTVHFRKLLSIERNPPIDLVIRLGVVPRLLAFLAKVPHPKLKFEAAWALTNVASGTSQQTEHLIQHGGIPVFVQLLSSTDDELREQVNSSLFIY